MVWSIRRWGLGLTLVVSSTSAWSEEPAILREPKPLNGSAVAPTLVPSGDQEVVRERYPNRNVKVERHVAQDAEGNFVNHGSWTMWDESGRLMGSGDYAQGKREGTWIRNFIAGECELVNGPLGKQFTGPFVSTAIFENDTLEGPWTIVDAKGRTVFEWNFHQGKRHGRCSWYYPNGEVWREVEYDNGEPDGEFTEWAPDGKVIASEKFTDGNRELVQIEWYSPGIKKTEATYLMARESTEVTIDWWNGMYRIKVVGKEGEDQRHGPWSTWYPNGQLAAQGHYRHDKPEGVFTFWHSNGQKSIEGAYDNGAQIGRWTWWHDNGLRAIAGEFEDGDQIGAWSWWQPNGKLAENAVFSDPIASPSTRVVPHSQVSQDTPPAPSLIAIEKEVQTTEAKSTLKSEPTLAKPQEKPAASTATPGKPRQPGVIRQAARPKKD